MEDDPKARDHFNLFRQVIEPELKPYFEVRDECEEHAVIPFASIWTIFKPGDLVWWEDDGQSVIGRMIETQFVEGVVGIDLYRLICHQIDWTGERFGIETTYQAINFFEGTRPVIGLPVMPLRYRPNADRIRNQHLNRGRKFEALRGYHFKAYEGPVLGLAARGFAIERSTTKKINDRVVIDAYSYHYFQGSGRPPLLPLNPMKVVAPTSHDPSRPNNRSQPMYRQISTRRLGPNEDDNDDYTSDEDDDDDDTSEEDHDANRDPPEVEPLTEKQLIICVPWVRGFSLKEKEWCQLAVDSVKDITWNDPFSNLVLPRQDKDLLLAFAQSKIKASENESTMNAFDDFVAGKGRGVIILLSGSPGVGKTLTAESIVEKMEVPLYTLSAGEIGIMPDSVERELKAVLEKCERWNAILLLDEADVFLKNRELNSLKRNELVSILLRLLEYYEGMMFLTTNRVSTIDPAFESRIDVSISYPDLTVELRCQIWTKSLFRSEEIRSGVGPKREGPPTTGTA